MKQLLVLVFLSVSCCAFSQTKTDTAALKPYVGTYRFPEGSVVPEVVVTMGSNGLTMSSTAGESELVRIAADTFSIVTFEGVAVFKRDTAKKISGVFVDARGVQLDGTRVEPTGFLRRKVENGIVRIYW